jgi:hypothetical protein
MSNIEAVCVAVLVLMIIGVWWAFDLMEPTP